MMLSKQICLTDKKTLHPDDIMLRASAILFHIQCIYTTYRISFLSISIDKRQHVPSLVGSAVGTIGKNIISPPFI